MIKAVFLVIAIASVAHAQANEMLSVDPTEYHISGKDRYGKEAYSISASINRNKERVSFDSLSVKIYEQTIEVDTEILKETFDPHLTKISATNDAGIFGSYFYIRIPFGKRGRCREARKYDLYKSIYVSSLGSMNGEGLEVKVSDPCRES